MRYWYWLTAPIRREFSGLLCNTANQAVAHIHTGGASTRWDIKEPVESRFLEFRLLFHSESSRSPFRSFSISRSFLRSARRFFSPFLRLEYKSSLSSLNFFKMDSNTWFQKLVGMSLTSSRRRRRGPFSPLVPKSRILSCLTPKIHRIL